MDDRTDWSVEFVENESRRMEIMRKGFAEHLTSKRVNELLLENYCEALYARNIYEAALIYCFDHKKTYEEWRQMVAMCDQAYCPEQGKSGTVLTLSALREYVAKESQKAGSSLNTAFITRGMQTELEKTESDENFMSFLLKNIENFSAVREKARYYFSKYTMLYIDERIQKYLSACEKVDLLRCRKAGMLSEEEKSPEKTAVEELSFLKPLKPLQRSADTAKFDTKGYLSMDEKKKLLAETSLTSGGIFDAMNQYYFGYISIDWLELCLEMYPDIEEWPTETRRKIAQALGYICPETTPEEEAQILDSLEERIMEKEVELEQQWDRAYVRREDAAAAFAGADKTFQHEAAGETAESIADPRVQEKKATLAFRDFLLGRKDVNRRTLIMYLIFIQARTALTEENKVTVPRLNKILLNCGFSQLQPNREFDRFVMGFLKAEDPIVYFQLFVQDRLKNQKESVLYAIYENSYNHQKELVRDMLRKRLM